MIHSVYRWFLKKQCCPNSSDIKIVSKLCKELRSDDPLKTVSNVLEWQDKNISYSYETTGFFASVVILILFLLFLAILVAPSEYLYFAELSG